MSAIAEVGTVPDFSLAFQPIVDAPARSVVSCEALIRGPAGEPAWQVLQSVPAAHAHRFDQRIREQAIDLAAQLGLGCQLNLNFLPQSLDSCLDPLGSTIEAATRHHLPLDRLVLEVSEQEVIGDQPRFAEAINEYRAMGVQVAIDDFGAGYSGLNLLVDFQPDQLKLDMKLIRGIEGRGPSQAVVRAICQACYDLGIDVVAEGVETVEEYAWLAGQGLRLFQGFLFARPAFRQLPPVHFPDIG